MGVTLLVTVPVARYLRHGFASMLKRTDFFVNEWWNHSFKNTIHAFAPKLAEPGRLATILLAFIVTIAAAARLVAARRRDAGELSLRVVAFVSAATSLMIGLPVYSGPYCYLMVLPGLLLLPIQLPDIQSILALGRSATLALGAGLLLCLALALRFRWLGSEVPLAGIALIGLLICLGTLTWMTAPRALTLGAGPTPGHSDFAPAPTNPPGPGRDAAP